MSELMKQILARKEQGRKNLAAQPVSAKIEQLEQLRNRHQLIASSSLRSGTHASYGMHASFSASRFHIGR